MEIKTEWQKVGETSNTKYYQVKDNILLVVPNQNEKDDKKSAEENAEFQIRFAQKNNEPCATIVIVSNLMSQDSDARRVYAEKMNTENFFAAALIVTNPLSRAIGSFFLGLTKPKFPTQLFPDVDSAIVWINSKSK